MPEPGLRPRWLEAAGLAAVLALAAWFYGWTATSAGSPLTWERPHYDLYNRLADGFLAGRTSFLEEPPVELAQLADPYDPAQNAPFRRYHDVTYFEGRYYLYFGPAPALLLLAPWKLVTGGSLPQNLAVVAFAWGAAALGVLLLWEIRRRFFPTAPAWLVFTGALAVSFGSLWLMLLRRPIYYELAIASAGFLALGALWCLLRSEVTTARRSAWLAGCSLLLGLAVAGRPNYGLGSIGCIAVCAITWWQQASGAPRDRWRSLHRPLLALVGPFAACMAALMAYNAVRFGSPFEVGTSYMLAGSNQTGVAQVGLRYVPINLYYYLAAAPHFSAHFPFVAVTGFPWFQPPAGYGGQENMYGFPLIVPLVWLILALWSDIRRGAAPKSWQLWTRSTLALAAGNWVFLLGLMGAANRYLLDFVPMLVVLAVVGVMRAATVLAGWRRTAVQGAWIVALAVSLAANVLLSLQHNGLFRHHNPEGYARLARLANGLVEPLVGSGRMAGPLRIELSLPRERTGKLEPLVVTGWSFQADFLYVYYKDDRHIQIGFEHTSYGGPMSPPIRVDYDRPLVLEVDFGSLYPPREHPYFAGWAEADVERRKRTLRVRIDGRMVHEGQYGFYDASPGDVSVGRNHVSEAFGRKFTGVIRRIERPARLD